jgi:hypothetical protein
VKHTWSWAVYLVRGGVELLGHAASFASSFDPNFNFAQV